MKYGAASSLAAGGIAGLCSQAASLIQQALFGAPTPADAFADPLLRLAPGVLTGELIDRMQFNAKPLLLVGFSIGQLLVAMVLGTVYGRWWARRVDGGRARLLGTGVAIGLIMWSCGEIALAVAGPDGSIGVVEGLWLLPGSLVLGLLLVILTHMLAFEPGMRPAIRDRRRILLVAGLGGSLVLTSGLLRRVIDSIGEQPSEAMPSELAEVPVAAPAQANDELPRASSLPTSAPAVQPTAHTIAPTPTATAGVASPTSTPFPNLTPQVTANERFYVVSKNFVDPALAPETWRLQVDGLVKRPLSLSYQDLMSLPAVRRHATFGCISNVVGGNLLGNAAWSGIGLADLLQQAGPGPQAAWVVLRSADSYLECYPLEMAMDPGVLLVHTMNGVPLPTKHGFPLRVVVPGRYGMKAPKWLTRIELVDAPYDGYWVTRGWDREAVIRTLARIDSPTDGSTVAGPRLTIRGIAFAGNRGISKVEVSVDDGETWHSALVGPSVGVAVWQRWEFAWADAPVGSYRVTARATDGDGVPQTRDPQAPFPAGATGYHAISFTVTEATG